MTTTTQKTGKAWKGLQSIGCLGCLAGIVVICTGIGLSQSESPRIIAMGLGGIFFGLPIYLFARVGGWWFHG